MSDLSVEILKQIRDEGRRTNQRLDQTNERLDLTNERLERLEQRQHSSEIKLTTELIAVTGAIHGLRDVLLEDRNLRRHIDDHEERIRRLEAK